MASFKEIPSYPSRKPERTLHCLLLPPQTPVTIASLDICLLPATDIPQTTPSPSGPVHILSSNNLRRGIWPLQWKKRTMSTSIADFMRHDL